MRGIKLSLLRKHHDFRPKGRGIKPSLLVRQSEREGGVKKTKIIFTTLVSRLEEGHKIKNPSYNKL